MSHRVLITGINGFAGRYLSAALIAAGCEVTGLVNTHGQSEVPGVKAQYAVDLRDLPLLRRIVADVQPTHVVHLAAISFVGHDNIGEIYEINVMGTRHLLMALSELATKPEAVLLTSSANVYGNSVREVLSELDAINPANDYAVSKIAMEYMARQFSNILKLIVVRPFNYTGRGQSTNFLVPKIVSHFQEKADFIELGNTDISRDFSDVRTVSEYFVRLLMSPQAIGETYNVCSGVPYSLKAIVDMCQEISGHKMGVQVSPAFVRANEVKTLVGNPKKLHNAVGIIDKYGLSDTLAWMLPI